LDSDGSVLKAVDVRTDQGGSLPTSRAEVIISGSDLSAQPTDRFLVKIEITLATDAEEALIGGITTTYE